MDFYLQGGKIINETLSSSVKIFLQVNCLHIKSTLNKTLICKKNCNLQYQQKYITKYVSIHKQQNPVHVFPI